MAAVSGDAGLGAANAEPPANGAPVAASVEDLADIERALGQDAASSAARAPAPVVAGPPVAPTATGATSPPASTAVAGAGGASHRSLNPDLSFIADLALAGFSRPNLQLGGHDPTTNGFNLQVLEFAAAADVDPYFAFRAFLAFGSDGVEVEEVYATTTSLPASLQVRAGKFLTRFGRLNPTHPHAWDFVDQPLVLGKMLGPDGNRGLGAEISWLSPLPWYAELVLSESMPTGACCARSFYGDVERSVDSPVDFETMLALKQFFPLSNDWSLAVGLSSALGPNASHSGARTEIVGTDLYLKYRPISFQSFTVVSLQVEALARRRDSIYGVLDDQGGYAQALWRFAQRWAVGARGELVSGLEQDVLDPDWTKRRTRISGNVTFFPTEFSRLRLQVSRDRPAWQAQPIHAAFLALEVVAGAHGAHAF